jgi:hypothetical protein
VLAPDRGVDAHAADREVRTQGDVGRHRLRPCRSS